MCLLKVSSIQKVSGNLLVSIKIKPWKPSEIKKQSQTKEQCTASLTAVADALYAIGGKWKLRIIIALSEGNKRFNELQRTVEGLSARVLSNELKELELNGFVKRTVYADTPVIVEYELTKYSESLHGVLGSLSEWGTMHRKKIKQGLSSHNA